MQNKNWNFSTFQKYATNFELSKAKRLNIHFIQRKFTIKRALSNAVAFLALKM